MLGTDDSRLPGLRRFTGWNRPRPQIDAAATATATATDGLGRLADPQTRRASHPDTVTNFGPRPVQRRERRQWRQHDRREVREVWERPTRMWPIRIRPAVMWPPVIARHPGM